MLSALELKNAQHSVRGSVCVACLRRPSGSESWTSDAPRACEAACPVFAHLSTLRALAIECTSGSRRRVELSVFQHICEHGCATSQHGGACWFEPSADCPLSRHANQTVAVLDALAASFEYDAPTLGQPQDERL